MNSSRWDFYLKISRARARAHFGLALLTVGTGACHADGPTPPAQPLTPVLAWKVAAPGGGGFEVSTIPVVSPTQFFGVTPRGSIVALNRATGSLAWTSEPGDRKSVAKRLLLNGGRLLWAGKSVAGYDIATGNRIWTYTPAFDTERCDPTVAGELFIVCMEDWTVVALRASTGEVVWSRALRDSLAGLPQLVGVAASGDTVFAAVRQDYSQSLGFSVALLFALDRRTGAMMSKTQEGNYTNFIGDIATPTVSAQNIILSHLLNNRLTAIDRVTSRVAWRFEGEAGWTGFLGPLSIVDGVIYAASGDRRVYALDASSGQLRWKSPILEGSQDYAVACGPVVLTWSGVNVRVISRATGAFLSLLEYGPAPTYEFTTRPVVDGADVFLQSSVEIRKMSCGG